MPRSKFGTEAEDRALLGNGGANAIGVPALHDLTWKVGFHRRTGVGNLKRIFPKNILRFVDNLFQLSNLTWKLQWNRGWQVSKEFSRDTYSLYMYIVCYLKYNLICWVMKHKLRLRTFHKSFACGDFPSRFYAFTGSQVACGWWDPDLHCAFFHPASSPQLLFWLRQ